MTLDEIVEKILAENLKAVADASDNEGAINFLVGQLIRVTKGKVSPVVADVIIRSKLMEKKKIG